MIRKKTSVVLCTYNRAHLLRRSLICYVQQTLKDFELIILDDNSHDETEKLISEYKNKLDITYIKLEDKKKDEWRDAACIINRGIKIAKGKHIYITHPEVMLPPDCLKEANELLSRNSEAFINIKTYYLSFFMQEELDNVCWKEDFYAIKKLNGFYETYDIDSFLAYHEKDLCEDVNKNIKTDFTKIPIEFCAFFSEIMPIFDSWVFGGMNRKKWIEMGGLNEYTSWGAVDEDFIIRRRELNIPTLNPEGVYVVHQNHDKKTDKFVPTNRSVKLLKIELEEKYNKKQNFLSGMKP